MYTPSSRTTLFLLSALLILALALRLYRVGTYSIYFDEKSTLLISQSVVLEGYNQKDVFSKTYFTPAEFWKPKTFNDFIEANIRGDIGNSPAYYGVLWVWLKIFGLSDASLRMPSVIFSTLIVALLFVFVRRHFKSDALALTSAAIAAIEPFFVAYSHIARNYSMTFFLTLLGTHLFLLIMERVRNGSRNSKREPVIGLYLAYGLVFVASVLSHYLTVTVFLCHGLYALLYLRNSRSWVALGITGVVGLGLVSLWFIFGGGKYTFFTLDYQAKFYRNIALTNPYKSGFGTILPATIPNITVRAIPIFTDLFMLTNGVISALVSLRNVLIALGVGAAVTFIIHQYIDVRKPPVWVYASVTVLLLLGLPFYVFDPVRALILSVVLPFVYLIGRYIVENVGREQKPQVVMLFLLAFVPTFFLLFMAWRSGHTFGITQRYSGFSFPYVCIFVAMGVQKLASLRWWFSVPIAIVLLIQAGNVIQLIADLYADQAPKYTFFSTPRIANPYWSSAQKLKELYMPGDTILYPNKERPIYSEKIDKSFTDLSLLDAQLVNVYLPKEATYIQRIDPTERNRIVLVKGKTGEKITIFDFKGKTYRYGE